MADNTTVQISKTYRDKLARLASAEKRTLAGQLEYLIDAAINDSEGAKSMNQRTLANTAAEIVRFVRENGRVNQQEDGTEDPASLWAEVEFEASDRGYPSSEAIADYAKEHFC